jgi:hypothetical protein
VCLYSTEIDVSTGLPRLCCSPWPEKQAAGVLVLALAGLTLLLQDGQAIGSASARCLARPVSGLRCSGTLSVRILAEMFLACGLLWSTIGRMWKAYFPIGSFLEAPRTLSLFGFLPTPSRNASSTR